MSFRRCDWLFPPSAREVSPWNRPNYKSTRERVDSKGLYGRGRRHLIILQCRRILGERNLLRVRNIVVAAIFDFMTVEDWGEYKY